jgi:transcription termination factor Rho
MSTNQTVSGVIEIFQQGQGILRAQKKNYQPDPMDATIPPSLMQKYKLKAGLLVEGEIEPLKRGARPRLDKILSIEGKPPTEYQPRNFDELTPIDPHQQIIMETGEKPLTTRVIDLLTPIGKGQRALIVAPPRSGKTILLQHLAHAVSVNYPDLHSILLLIDERPEEVTEFRRSIKGEVVASSSDRDAANHVRTAEMVLERARRLTEMGKDVFLLIDSLTRLARAYNKNQGPGGRTMTGGMDVRALEVPKRLFGQARVFEEGGSLTVIGTALVETGSRMDDLIFQEFKGTGNMELVLDRKLADKRVYPAIDISQSGTRKEERLFKPQTLEQINLLRKGLAKLNPGVAMESLAQKLADYSCNLAFLEKVATFVR